MVGFVCCNERNSSGWPFEIVSSGNENQIFLFYCSLLSLCFQVCFWDYELFTITSGIKEHSERLTLRKEKQLFHMCFNVQLKGNYLSLTLSF